MNGVLADEMGLGKTVQTIAFFALLRHRRKGAPPKCVANDKRVDLLYSNRLKKNVPGCVPICMPGIELAIYRMEIFDITYGKFRYIVWKDSMYRMESFEISYRKVSIYRMESFDVSNGKF